jgi:hypothetical protein
VRLEIDDPQAVCECPLRMPVGDPAGELVGKNEAEPDRELLPETSPSMRQMTPPNCDYG